MTASTSKISRLSKNSVALKPKAPIVIAGRVLGGEGLGRGTGYPTANLDPGLINEFGLEHGVYAAWGTIGKGEPRQAIVVVGTPHTINKAEVKLEVYFLDFDEDIRGQMVTATIVEKLRPIGTFTDLPSLVSQIRQDIERARTILIN